MDIWEPDKRPWFEQHEEHIRLHDEKLDRRWGRTVRMNTVSGPTLISTYRPWKPSPLVIGDIVFAPTLLSTVVIGIVITDVSELNAEYGQPWHVMWNNGRTGTVDWAGLKSDTVRLLRLT